jgi:hypothetical protein
MPLSRNCLATPLGVQSARRFTAAMLRRLDSDTQPFRSLARALVEAQQSETDDRGTRNEKRCEVDGIECPNRVTGKWLTRAIDYRADAATDGVPLRSTALSD